MAPTKIETPWNALSWIPEQPSTPTPPLKYSFARMEMKFDTDAMRGTGLAAYVMTYLDGSDTSLAEFCSTAYDGMVMFEGSIMGKTGKVALHERGTTDKGDVAGEWVVATDTATGELKGIKGTGGYKMKAGTADKTIAGYLEVEF